MGGQCPGGRRQGFKSILLSERDAEAKQEPTQIFFCHKNIFLSGKNICLMDQWLEHTIPFQDYSKDSKDTVIICGSVSFKQNKAAWYL